MLGARARFASHHMRCVRSCRFLRPARPGQGEEWHSPSTVLSGARWRLTLESQLCFLANFGSCREGILGWRKDLGGSGLRALGPPPFPSFSWQMFMRALRTRPWAGQQRERRGENSPTQAVELTVHLLQLGPCCMGGLAWGWAVPATEELEKLQGGGALEP